MDLDSFVQRMKVLAAAQRLNTTKALAEAAGVNAFRLHNLSKSGRRAFPTADITYLVARTLNTTVEYLLTGEGTAHEQKDPEVDAFCKIVSGMSKEELAEVRGYIEGRSLGRSRPGSREQAIG